MKVLSLFSGVGGFDLGLENAGMETVFQCEWDKHATKILERHWPHVPRWGDVSTLTGQHILAHAPVIDVVAWGSPCQDLSVAGKRAGLQGARSGLFHEGVRIIKELRELTDGKYPRISIWENVAGALSSGGGADFGQVLYEMDEAGACFSEWRILDAQYFGVPQRRRRVFLVSVFDPATAARCPDPLLPVSEGVQWHPATGNTPRQTVTGETAASFGSSNFGGWAETDTAITLSQRDYKGSMTMVVGSLAARDYKGVGNQYVNEGKVIVEPFTKSKRPQSATDDETWVANQPNPTLNSFDQGDTRATTLIAFENSYRDAARIATEGVTNTLSAKMGTGGNNTPMVAIPAEAVAYSIREDAKANTFSATELDRANALSALRPSPQSHHAQMFIAEQRMMAVRRLTPLECERLMGWPDDWTAGQSDTHRYKQCGNGVASPVATWIAQQLIKLDQ